MSSPFDPLADSARRFREVVENATPPKLEALGEGLFTHNVSMPTATLFTYNVPPSRIVAPAPTQAPAPMAIPADRRG